jgi:hypothetical protein
MGCADKETLIPWSRAVMEDQKRSAKHHGVWAHYNMEDLAMQ